MSNVVFTFPGKAGDAIHQFPVAYHWAKQHGKRFVAWLDERSCAMVKPLFEAQPCVEAVEFKPGIEGYNCGGQPFHFDLPTADYEGRNIYHLGLRSFPQRQLTLECLATANVPVDVEPETIAEECPFQAMARPLRVFSGANGNGEHRDGRRLLVHGQGVCPHNRQTPAVWKFLARIHGELDELFDEVCFVGSADDREVGKSVYPHWAEFDDGGDFLRLAEVMAGSQAFIGCGSAPAALAQWMKIPTLRVHDPIGSHPKVIWSGLGENQANLTEIELRKDWAGWRDRWLAVPA